ncbi:hypothetical protein [Halomonas sp.]|uniref:hypothetical protein n=1 Tax=Halomonas sp. TaxID=1486246 RepID=UPI00356973BA
MLDLAGAIRQQLKNKTPPPAETADTAETAQPRALAAEDDLRESAELPAEKALPAASRNRPQPPQSSETRANKGLQRFPRKSAESAGPAEKKNPKRANPEAVLLKVARQLQASPASLRAMLTDDDMQDIADGMNSPAVMLEFFRLAQENGELLADQRQPVALAPATRAPEITASHVQRLKAWNPSHERFIDHLTACPDCFAPRARYCTTGGELRRAYLEAYQKASQPEE